MPLPREQSESPLISPKELATRWRVSRSTVDRISRREGFTRILLGYGRNGVVRFYLCDVLSLEDRLSIESNPQAAR